MFLRVLVCVAPYLFAVLVSCGVNHHMNNQAKSSSLESKRDEVMLRLHEAESSPELLGYGE